MTGHSRPNRLKIKHEEEKFRRSQLERAVQACRERKDRPIFLRHKVDSILGYAIFATMDLAEGEFLLEYPGELISKAEGRERKVAYKKDGKGCFLFYFTNKMNGNSLCIDGTNDERFGRYVNDSPKAFCNAEIQQIDVDGTPSLCIFSTVFIPKGTEIRYDYAATNLWWRREHKTYNKPTYLDLKIWEQKIEDLTDESGTILGKTTPDNDYPMKQASSNVKKVFNKPSMKSFMTGVSCTIPDKYVFTKADVEIVNKIGEGSFGEVFLATFKDGYCAIKKGKVNEIAAVNKRHLKAAAEEYLKLNHKNIVEFLGIDFNEGYMIFEYCELKITVDGDDISINSLMGLLTVLENNMPKEWRKQAVTDTLSGLIYLHRLNIVVGDLKPSNILVTETYDNNIVFKIADLAVSKNSASSLMTSSTRTVNQPTIGFSFLYLAPKLLSPSLTVLPKFSSKTDIYAFSIVCYQICFPSCSFPDFASPIQFMTMLSNGWRPEIHDTDDHFFFLMVKMMKCCWNSNPSLRPTAEKALEIWKNGLNEIGATDRVDLNSNINPENFQNAPDEQQGVAICDDGRSTTKAGDIRHNRDSSVEHKNLSPIDSGENNLAENMLVKNPSDDVDKTVKNNVATVAIEKDVVSDRESPVEQENIETIESGEDKLTENVLVKNQSDDLDICKKVG